MAGADNHKYLVNVGLYSTAADTTTATQGDVWFNSTEGRVKTQTAGAVSIMGPNGAQPQMVYDVANAWYPLQPGGTTYDGSSVNNRAFAFPLAPGRKCTLVDFAMALAAAVHVGNVRAMLYGTLPTGLPGALIADYGTKLLTGNANTTITGWTAGTALEPTLYWVVLAMQTSTAGSWKSQFWFSPLLPLLAVPTGVRQSGALYTDTGFSGAAPATFGTPAAGPAPTPPSVFVKLTV